MPEYCTFFEGRLHVDLLQKIDAAAEVQPKVHRQGTDRRQPSRRARHLVQRDDVVIAKLLLQHVLGLEPRIAIGKAHFNAGRIDRLAAVGDVRRLERALDGLKRRGVDLDIDLAGRYLYCRHLRKEVGQGVDDADKQRNADEHVFPG
jgi:hypothetical protein